MMPASSSAGISSAKAMAERVSETVTRAPRPRRNMAAERPERPRPTTRTRLFFKSIIPLSLSCAPSLAQLQGGQGKQGEDERENPEACDHLRLGPAQQLEVVVERRHLED